MKNIRTKKNIEYISEGWAGDLLTKYKKQFNIFFAKLKKQFAFNDSAREIIADYIRTGELTKEEAQQLKIIVRDTLKLVGLGVIALNPLPGGTLLLIFIINSAKRLGIDIIPSQFINHDLQTLETEPVLIPN